MTPDLRALAHAYIVERARPIGVDERSAVIVNTADLAAFAATIDAAAVARCAKALRAACDRHFESIRIWKLRQLADEMEAET